MTDIEILLSGETAKKNNLLFVIVSWQDADLGKYRWHIRKDGNTFYALRRRPTGEPGTVFISMHKLIAERMKILSIDKPEVDHVDRNGLNNRRSNLRAASRSDNAHNRKAEGWTFDDHGKKPYKVVVAGKYIGRYMTEEEAVVAYNNAKEQYV